MMAEVEALFEEIELEGLSFLFNLQVLVGAVACKTKLAALFFFLGDCIKSRD